MRLNSDCVRDILLTVEENCDFYRSMDYDRDKNTYTRLTKYTHDEIIYHIKQCELSKLIINPCYCDDGDNIIIQDLSPDGHKFLANIREDNIWNGVKSVAKKVGSTSLSALTDIASNVISELIRMQFQSTNTP